jgi:hypothetical protein
MVSATNLWPFTVGCNETHPLIQGVFVMNDFSRPYIDILLCEKGLCVICMLT